MDLTRSLLLLLLALPGLLRADDAAHQRLDTFVTTDGIDCHGADDAEGGVDIEAMIVERPLVRHTDKWLRIQQLVREAEMPPQKKKKQPDAGARKQAVADLKTLVQDFDFSAISNPGYERVRRLTRAEYRNTVYDLLYVDYNVTDRFPEDLTGTSGFDNSANTLYLQTVQMERYIAAADSIIESAFPADPGKTPQHGFDIPSEPGKQTVDAVRQLLIEFLVRAYRQPVEQRELDVYVKRFETERAAGKDYREAVKAMLKTVLIAPQFVFRYESHQPGDKLYRVDDFELAARRSYFLWGSMPDDPLFALADQGTLHEPGVLRQQVKRMLNDRRAEKALGNVFAGQWLGFDKCGTRVRIDPIDNKFATEKWYWSMRQETALFVTHLIREDRPIAELLTADYTFLNDTLTRQYQLGNTGVTGAKHRLVKLKTHERGGLLGHAGLLFVTSFPDRTSPVNRGKWILTDLLGTPPPPPPPDAGELEVEEDRPSSIRAQLARHRANPKCSSCHEQIDPLGLGLECYDRNGRFRRADTSGELPDGTAFNGPHELKHILATKRLDDLRRNIAEKLLAYALGRQLEYYDEPAIGKILANQKNADTWQMMIQSVVESYPFQHKMKQPD
jgi:hypothetical protein